MVEEEDAEDGVNAGMNEGDVNEEDEDDDDDDDVEEEEEEEDAAEEEEDVVEGLVADDGSLMLTIEARL